MKLLLSLNLRKALIASLTAAAIMPVSAEELWDRNVVGVETWIDPRVDHTYNKLTVVAPGGNLTIDGITVVVNELENNRILDIRNGASVYTGAFVANAGSNTTIHATSGLFISNNADSTIVGPIDGAGNISFSGTGETTISGSNTLSGNIFLEAGSLVAGSATAFGTANITVSESTSLDLTSFAVSNNIIIKGSNSAEVQVDSDFKLYSYDMINDGSIGAVSGETMSLGKGAVSHADLDNVYLETGNSTVSNCTLRGESHIAADTGSTTINNVSFASGTGLNQGSFSTDFALDSLTATGTLTNSSVTFTELSFNVQGLTEIGDKIIFTTTDTLTIGDLAGTDTGITGGQTGYNYAWNVVEGNLVITVSITELTVSGVDYSNGHWDFTMSDKAFNDFKTGLTTAGAEQPDLIISGSVLEQFILLREGALEDSQWMNDLLISNTIGDDSINLDDYLGKFTINGAEYVAGQGYILSEIPEPSTVTLSLLALAGLTARRRRKA